MRRRFAPALILVGLAALAGACNTVEGAGRDIQSGGRAISETADTVKRQISN